MEKKGCNTCKKLKMSTIKNRILFSGMLLFSLSVFGIYYVVKLLIEFFN